MRAKTPIEALYEIEKFGAEATFTFTFSQDQLDTLLQYGLIEALTDKHYRKVRITESGKLLIFHCNKITEARRTKIEILMKMVDAITTIEKSATIMMHINNLHNQAASRL